MTNREIYKLLMLIEDLRKELQKIIPSQDLFRGKLTDGKLSILLGKSKNHLNLIKSQVKKSPKYSISLQTAEEYKVSLLSLYQQESEKAIEYINKYCNLNSLRKTTDQTFSYHPNLDINYFKEINTKEKAYWLGFLYADGYIGQPTRNVLRVGVEIHKKDEILINRFATAIGFNLNHKHYRKNKNHVYIRFANKKIIADLMRHGLKRNKSAILDLPVLGTLELYLAFLLGFYDGDGQQGTTEIVSSSLQFLKQIKIKFAIPYKIRIKNHLKKDYYYLTLGASLFNKMMSNYKLSLPRKRKYFYTPKKKNHL